jgi:hypothetical protein
MDSKGKITHNFVQLFITVAKKNRMADKNKIASHFLIDCLINEAVVPPNTKEAAKIGVTVFGGISFRLYNE